MKGTRNVRAHTEQASKGPTRGSSYISRASKREVAVNLIKRMHNATPWIRLRSTLNRVLVL